MVVVISKEILNKIDLHVSKQRPEDKHALGFLIGYRLQENVYIVGAAKCRHYCESQSHVVSDIYTTKQAFPQWEREIFGGADHINPGLLASIPAGFGVVGIYFTFTSEDNNAKPFAEAQAQDVNNYILQGAATETCAATLVHHFFLDYNKIKLSEKVGDASWASSFILNGVSIGGEKTSKSYWKTTVGSNAQSLDTVSIDSQPSEKLEAAVAEKFAFVEVPAVFEVPYQYQSSKNPGMNQERKSTAIRTETANIVKSLRYSSNTEVFFTHSDSSSLLFPSWSEQANSKLLVRDLFKPSVTSQASDKKSATKEKPKTKAKGKGGKGKGKGGKGKSNKIDFHSILDDEDDDVAEQTEESETNIDDGLNRTGCNNYTQFQLHYLPTSAYGNTSPFAGALEFAPVEDEEMHYSKHGLSFSTSGACYALLDEPATVCVNRIINSISAQLLALTWPDVHPSLSNSSIFNIHIPFQTERYSPYETEQEAIKIEDYLLDNRVVAHHRFFLSLDKPLLRMCHSINLLNLIEQQQLLKERSKQTRLLNVHEGLTRGLLPNTSATTQHLIDGNYEYYHYRQDDFNDDGWGCAYRSLQTIISWFVLQDYASVTVPTHKEIQKALYEMGDKGSKFVGSKEWIGAFEVSLCLQKFADVTSKIMNVSSGRDLASKGRELASHFDTQGTPVMMGGGVLAYTLLGVDYSEATGDIRFLILDPHYTGSDNLDTIREKDWIGWKTADIFREDAFYNLCLPQRPKGV